MEKFLENLASADKMIAAADHMAYVTFPLIKDRRLLLKILQETKNSVTLCINAILQYEYFSERISLYKDPKQNFAIFTDRCAENYGITKADLDMIHELFEFIERHKDSPFEFMKGEKVVVLNRNSTKTSTMTIERAKEMLILAKTMVRKTRQAMSQR